MCGRGLRREIHLSVRKSLSGEMHASEVRFGKREVDIPARSSESVEWPSDKCACVEIFVKALSVSDHTVGCDTQIMMKGVPHETGAHKVVHTMRD